MTRRFVGALLAGCALSTLISTNALADKPKWGAHVDFEGRWSSMRTLGDAGLFAPLWQSQRSMMFTDIRGKFDSQEGREGNFGLGWRHMMSNGWNVGAYGYYDVRRSPFGNMFQQVTLGAEALSADFDIRANVYLPFGTTTKDAGFSGGVSSVDASGGLLQVVTSAKHQMLERAMTGFDGEIGWRAPVFDVDSLMQVRLFAGGYHFSGGGAGPDVSGPRGRIEFSMDAMAGTNARLTFGAEWQHDDVRGAQTIATARFRVPLHQDRPTTRLSTQERRMTERVVRDVDIVSARMIGSQVAAMIEEGAVTENGDALTGVTFVEAGGHYGLTSSIMMAPAGNIVVLNGNFTGLMSPVMTDPNRTVMGGGSVLQVRGASTGAVANFYALGAPAYLSGDVGNTAPIGLLAPAAGSTIVGLTLLNHAADGGVGIDAQFAPGVRLIGNTVLTSGTNSAGITLLDSNDSLISGNVIRTWGNSSSGIVLENSGNTLVTNNSILTSGDSSHGIHVLNSAGVSAVKNQVVSSAANGWGISFEGSAFGFASQNDVSVSGSQADGFRVKLSDNVTLSGNKINGSGRARVLVSFDDSNDGVIQQNTFSAPYDGMLRFWVTASDGNNLDIDGNRFGTGDVDDPAYRYAIWLSNQSVLIRNNHFNGRNVEFGASGNSTYLAGSVGNTADGSIGCSSGDGTTGMIRFTSATFISARCTR